MKVVIFLSAAFVLYAAGLCAQPQPGSQLWMIDAGGTIRSSPAIAPDGKLYFGAVGILYAITNAGSNAWTFTTSEFSDSSPALGCDGTIYYSSGYLYALNPNGSEKWRYAAQSGNGSPAIGPDNTVYIHGGGYLHAVYPDGNLKWKYIVEGGSSGVFNSPSIGPDGVVYIGASDYYALHALKSDGSEKWRFPLPNLPGDTPAIGQSGNIYIVSDGLYAFNPSGTNLWAMQPASFYRSGQAVGKDGTLYIANAGAGTLYALTPAGDIKWQANVTTNSGLAPSSSTPAIDSSGVIYYAAFSSLFAVSPDGNVKWTFTTGDGAYAYTSPTIGPDGTIYIGFGSKLYAICNTNKLADSPWPMYRQNARHTGKIEKPSLQQPKKRADANFEFQLYAQIDQTQTVQTSTDLVAWAPLTNVVVTNVPMDVVDLCASNFPTRFYRTLSQ
jgi:hypothetical protein